jgi:propanol-preferring alcohol dehydrogenase
MAHKMQAAVVEQFGKTLALQELDIPSPEAGEILVKTEACGVCHTDLPCRAWRLASEAHASVHTWHEGAGVLAPAVSLVFFRSATAR